MHFTCLRECQRLCCGGDDDEEESEAGGEMWMEVGEAVRVKAMKVLAVSPT